ncbi:MAG: YbhB/YbcL family Raf kinase inhibitor-like protein [candidate division WOR-3 bacterium]
MNKKLFFSFLLISLLLSLTDCESKTGLKIKESGADSLKVISSFENYSFIPKKFSYKGENISPEIEIRNIPEKTKSLLLIMEDPDAPAGKFIHWIVFNISPSDSFIPEGFSKNSFRLGNGILQGLNSLGEYSYFGPHPPFGTHRYFFKVFALDNFLPEDSTLTEEKILKIVENHIISYGELVGKFSKD